MHKTGIAWEKCRVGTPRYTNAGEKFDEAADRSNRIAAQLISTLGAIDLGKRKLTELTKPAEYERRFKVAAAHERWWKEVSA